MRKFLGFLLILLLLAALWLGNALFNPYGPSQQKFVTLKPGSSSRAIARTLQHEGVIRNYYAFLLLTLLEGRHKLKAGEYAFEHPASAFEI
ncbi:MAG TPA: hypothetical protein VNR20_02540 [Terriglobales bacterium]|nr:hypothetical protein [Terriglobales bacterium]